MKFSYFHKLELLYDQEGDYKAHNELSLASFMWLYKEIYPVDVADEFLNKLLIPPTDFIPSFYDDIIDLYHNDGKHTAFLKCKDNVPQLCDQLEKMGHLTPLLGFSFFLCKNSPDTWMRFIENWRRRGVCGPMTWEACQISADFIYWCIQRLNITKVEDFSDSDIDLLREEYIGKRIIRCYEPDDDVRTTEPKYNVIQKFVEKTLADKKPIVIAAWLAPIASTNPVTAAKLLTKYILPALTSTRFDQLAEFPDAEEKDRQKVAMQMTNYNMQTAICRSIVNDCFYAIGLCAKGADKISPHIEKDLDRKFGRMPINHKKVIDYLHNTNKPFSELFSTPTKGLGHALQALLSSSRVDHTEGNSDAEQRAMAFARLFNFFDSRYATSPFSWFELTAAVFLLAEDNINDGINSLINVYHDNGRSQAAFKDQPFTNMLLFLLFYRCKDFDRKSRLYQIIRQEKERLTLRFEGEGEAWEISDERMLDVEDEMYQATLDMVKEKYGDFTTTKTISDEEIERKLSEELKDLSPEEKKERILQYKIDQLEQITADMTSKTASFFTAKRVAYAKELEQSAATFLNQHPLKRGLYDSLADAVKRRIKNGLLESGVLFELNTILHEEDCENGAQGDNDRDYSAVILPMTKALELLGNLIFQGAIEDADLTQMSNAEKEKLKFFIKNGDWSDSLTLGNVAYMFKLEEFEGNPNYLPDLFKVIDKTKLPTLQGIDLGYQNLPLSKRGPMIDAKFTDNTDPAGVITNYNLKVLSVILQYITDNFRNKCAHKDKIGIAEYEQCKDLLVTGKHLIWILLYLLKDDIQLGAESSETNDN